MRFTDRVISLHPAVVTIVFVVLFIGAGVIVNAFPFGSVHWVVALSLSLPPMLGAVVLWHYSLYRAASDRNAEAVGHSGRRAFLFVLTALGTSAYLALFPLWITMAPTEPAYKTIGSILPVALLIGNLSYFAAIWASANALTRFDERAKTVELHKTLGTFLLELYLPIGIWVIFPRVKRLLSAPL